MAHDPEGEREPPGQGQDHERGHHEEGEKKVLLEDPKGVPAERKGMGDLS